jgi:hypothetical protein
MFGDAARSRSVLAPNDSIGARRPAAIEQPVLGPGMKPAGIGEYSQAQTELDAKWRADMEKRHAVGKPVDPIDVQKESIEARRLQIEQERLMPAGAQPSIHAAWQAPGGTRIEDVVNKTPGGATVGEQRQIDAANTAHTRGIELEAAKGAARPEAKAQDTILGLVARLQENLTAVEADGKLTPEQKKAKTDEYMRTVLATISAIGKNNVTER